MERPETGHRLTIELVNGDILDQDVDVIVNAWNQNLVPHWLLITQGVSGAIKRKAGTGPFEELRKGGPMQLGEARWTEAPGLSFRGIIHVAGISHLWRSSEASIRSSVRNALLLASSKQVSSIAFPAIGAGSSIALPNGRAIGVWGVSEAESLEIIEDEVRRSDFQGRVVIVKFVPR
jgi:O-acetyl-ADP-ribose deacetylase (regulator of RNase III)